MNVVYIYKAQPTGEQKVQDTKIIIECTMPEIKGDDWLQTIHEAYKTEGKLLNETLHNSLPGGTYDQLLVEMLKTKASHFAVSFGGE